VKRGEELCPVICGEFTAYASDFFVNAEQCIIGVPAQGTDDFWFNETKLGSEIIFAGSHFIRLRITVVGRPAFEDITDIDFTAS
jgi:hypothetical protein